MSVFEKMTEERFEEWTKGAGLDDAERALVRRDCGLSYDEGAIRMHVSHPTLEKRLAMKAYSKIKTTL